MAEKRLIVQQAAFNQAAVDWLVENLHEVWRNKTVCHLMLAGGGTPLPVYQALSRQALPWDQMVIYFGDERCVPVDDPHSNYRAIMQALFPQGRPDGLRVQRMRGEDEPETAARAYEAILPAAIDILVLGMGEDGHTASLFPGSSALTETVRQVLPVIGSKPPPQRLTITPPVIHAAERLLMLVAGAAKAEAVHRALDLGDVPAALARAGDWLMDEAAASRLETHSTTTAPSGR